ncbi:DUF2478 domain-containing protein [Celeribacter marinus]|uniref:DUF2478 domain-containing protein n=1 Tax=Celeribacter marinus TaxID=1397108 RepID=UPI003175A4D2
MLAFITAQGHGEIDAILSNVAKALRDQGVAIAGAVQVNTDNADTQMCHMDLQTLSSGTLWRISQSLGPFAQGCRLDPDGLERAVAQVEADMASHAPSVLIINKFGKQEADGRGFRGVIASALAVGIPVVVGVNPAKRRAFDVYCEGLAVPLEANVGAVLDWISMQIAP